MRRLSLPCSLLLALPLAACGGDDDDADDDGSGTGPVYAMMTQVYSVEDRTVYFTLTDTLDVDGIDLDGARELAGVANLAAIGGSAYISDGQAPIITRYEIDDELQWIERETISFADYPLGDNANFFYQYVLDDGLVYLPFDGTKRVVWDAAAMTIVGTEEDSSLALERKGLLLEAGGNRAAVSYEGAVMQPLFYHDEEWFDFGTTTSIAVYDPTSHEEARVIEAPCAGLAIATRAEDGTTYFGTWDHLPSRALFGEGPAPCVVRVGPDGELDEAWTTDLTAQTEGRFVSNFRYVGGGKAVGNVFHAEEVDLDFEGAYDPAIEEFAFGSGPHWRLWLFDVEQGTAQPVEGIDVDIGSGSQIAVLDGRTFLLLPFDDYARSRVYELGDDGVATARFDVAGDFFKWIRIR